MANELVDDVVKSIDAIYALTVSLVRSGKLPTAAGIHAYTHAIRLDLIRLDYVASVLDVQERLILAQRGDP